MRLHREIKLTRKTAWFMLNRIREAWSTEASHLFSEPVEFDETCIGERRRNMPKAKRNALTGRGAVGKAIAAGAKNRATNRLSADVLEKTDAAALQGFIAERAAPAAKVYPNDHSRYKRLRFDHEAVSHPVAEHVRDLAHTNGIERFWAVLKRADQGTFHHVSRKRLPRWSVQ